MVRYTKHHLDNNKIIMLIIINMHKNNIIQRYKFVDSIT